jgi:DNA-binding LacI/PurR family transcriptional regulator
MVKKYRPATIIEVAQRAGVSPSTVSRVLNGTAVVVPETEKRVRAAISDLNFSPRPAARQLVNQRTNIIGLLLPEISGEFFPPMLRGIEAGAREAGYDLLIHSTRDNRTPGPRPLREHNTDGVLIFPESVDAAELQRLYAIGFPVVLLHQSSPPGVQFPTVTVENKSGAGKLIDHLIEIHGCRRIAFLQGPASHEDSYWRERGYREALEAHSIPFDAQLVAFGGFDERTAYQTVQRWLLDGLDFDAVFAGDDDAATGVIAALNQAGRRIPEDVAVVGFDDVPFSRFLSPSLTTVRAPIEQVGRDAVRQLVRYINDKRVEPEVLLPTELVIRHSCGCG